MRPRAWSLSIVAAILAVGVAIPTLADAPVVTIAYHYSGPGELRGTMMANATAYGGTWPADVTVSFDAENVRLIRAVTWVNRTTVLPDQPGGIIVATPVDYSRSVSEVKLPSGNYTIHGGGDRTAVLRPSGHPAEALPSLDLQIVAEDASWTEPGKGPGGPAHWIDVGGSTTSALLTSGVDKHPGGFPMAARGWTFRNATVDVQGAATWHLRYGHITGPAGDIVQPRYEQEIANTTDPARGVRITTYRLEEAFLHLGQLSFEANEAPAWAIGALDSTVAGEMSVLQATGEAVAGSAQQAFRGQVLTVRGDFRVNERAVEEATGTRMSARASGAISVVGLDFEPSDLGVSTATLVTRAGVLVTVLLGMGAVAKQTAPVFSLLHARLVGKEITDHPLRRRILEILDDRRLARQAELVAALGASRSTVRHHTEVLLKNGNLRSRRMMGEVFLFAPHVDASAVIDAVVAADERFRVVRQAFHEGLPRPVVAQRVQDHFEVTARTARKYVQRYLDLMGQTQTDGA